MASAIGTLGNIPTLTVGGVVFVDLTTLIVLAIGTGGNGFATFRLTNGTAGHAVTALKTYGCRAISVRNFAASASSQQIGYGDTDVGFNSLSAPTTPVYHAGDTSAAVCETGANSMASNAVFFNIPAGKYPFISATSVAASIFGYET